MTGVIRGESLGGRLLDYSWSFFKVAIRAHAPTYGGDQKSLFSMAASERSRCVRVSRSPNGSNEIPSFPAAGARLRRVFASQEYPAKSGPPPITNSPIDSGRPNP